MLRRFEVGFRVDAVDRGIMSNRSTEVAMAGRWHTTSAEDDRREENENDHRARSDANANEQIIT